MSNLLKTVVSAASVWLGGNDPREQKMPAGHSSWLLPGPAVLNRLIEWANPTPRLAVAVVRVRS